MNYLTYEEYSELGGILDDPTAFERFSIRAFSRVAQETHGRIDAMAEIPIQVKHLCRDLIEYMHNNLNQEKALASASQSQGGATESESYVNKTSFDIDKDIEAIIFDYLSTLKDDEGTPLLYRGCV